LCKGFGYPANIKAFFIPGYDVCDVIIFNFAPSIIPSMVRKVFHFLKNKFFLVTVAFVVWLLFFDQNNFLYQQKLNRQLKEMQIEKNCPS